MKNRIISILTIFFLLINLMPVSIVTAASPKVTVNVTPNVEEANNGDTINYTVTCSATDKVQSIQLALDIPEGLTYVQNSGKVDSNINSSLGVTLDEADFTETEKLVTISHRSPFTLNGNVKIATFQCKVNNNAKGTVQVGLTDVEFTDEEIEVVADSNITKNYKKTTIIVLPTAISLNKTSLNLDAGKNEKLVATVSPEDATDKKVTWESSNNSVAKVTSDGTVSAVSKGTAKITAKTSNGKTATCDVTVKQPITGITLNKKSLELERGEKTKVTATIAPSNADGDKTVKWSSNKTSVATVSSDGTITAVAKGNATITATTSNGKTATCSVTVGVPLKSISFENGVKEKTLNKGENFNLKVIYNPEDTDASKTITWSSTDTSVAKVENGKVTAVGIGETTITATASNGKKAECKVKVVNPLVSISIKDSTSIQYGQTEKLVVTYNPEDTTDDKTITWESSDKNIAEISADGTIIAKGVGTATITAKASTGKTANCVVTVLPVELNSISIKEQNVVINKKENKNLTVIYNPENTTDDKTVTWEVADTNIVTIDETGKITPVNAGTTTITAKVGDKTATTTVTVVIPLESISLNETDKKLLKNETLDLSVIYNPEDTTDDKTVEWSSTDEKVAKVEDGKVTTLASGTTYIKAKVGDKEASCKVSVIVPLTGIKLNKESVTLLKGQTDTLITTFAPEDTTFVGKASYKSSDESIITVNEDGKLTAIKEGEATITATVKDGENEFSATCEVTVKEIPLNTITIDKKDFELNVSETEKLNVIFEPENTTDDKTIEWSSSDESIVSVDNEGVVTAKAEGTAIITAKVGEKETQITITAKIIPIKALSLEGTSTVANVGDIIDIKLTVNPTNATYADSIKYTSSNSDVILVKEDGTIIAKGAGKAILTAETQNGIKQQIEIEVKDADEANITKAVNNKKTNQTKKSLSPKTGDLAIELLIALMIVSGLGIVAIIIKNKKR